MNNGYIYQACITNYHTLYNMLLKRSFSLLLSASFVNVLLFVVFFILTKPVYDTNEDVYVLYLTSGGFGNPPTGLLHYNYGLNFLLGILLKNLFVVNHTVNWYTLILLCCHYLACTVILYELISRNSTFETWLFYLAGFSVFECKFLLQLNFTNTPLIITIAALMLLLRSPGHYHFMLRMSLSMLLLVLASFFRIHVLIPLTGLSLPFLFYLNRRKTFLQLAAFFCITATIIIVFNRMHQIYYTAAIPGWQQEEDYRQTLYKFYNNKQLYKPAAHEEWYTESNLIYNNLTVDTSYLSIHKLNQMYAALKQRNHTTVHDTTQEWKWFRINNRIFVTFVVITLLLLKPDKRTVISGIVAIMLTVSGLAYLRSAAKLSDYFIISCCFLFVLLMVQSSNGFRGRGLLYRGIVVMWLLFTAWGVTRIYKLNLINMQGNNDFKLQCAEIRANPDKLFVIMHDAFALQKFYVFDLPVNFRLQNMVGYEHFGLNIYQPVLLRFNIADIKKMPFYNNVLFYGRRVPALENYFKQIAGDTICIAPVQKTFKFNEVYSFCCRCAISN